VKGRDFYDFIWYISRNVPVNLPHLEARIVQGGRGEIGKLNVPKLHNLLQERIKSVDIRAAAEEVRPFLRDARELTLWSENFFLDLVSRVKISKME